MYCSWCGAGMSEELWSHSVYCCRCGRPILGKAGMEEAIPSRSAHTLRVKQALRAARGTLTNRPVLFTAGSISTGIAGLALAPLLISAGQALGIAGAVTALLCIWLSSREEGGYERGVKTGLVVAVTGAVIYGSGYVLLVLGGLSLAVGIGAGAYAGVKACVEYRRMKSMMIIEPLLIEEGGER